MDARAGTAARVRPFQDDRGAARSARPLAVTNALRQTSELPKPRRLRRSVQTTPSRLTKDRPAAARGAISFDGCSTGIGVREPGVVSRTAATKSLPAVTGAGAASRTVR